MLVMWDEKVESDCSMLCSSPMSAKMLRCMQTRLPSPAGMNRPHWAIAVSRPRVLRLTVLPPVLGPVMTTVSMAPPIWKVIGTAVSLLSSGWRARSSSVRPCSTSSGRLAFIL